MHTVEVVVVIIYQLKLTDKFLEFSFCFFQFVTEHIELTEQCSRSVACSTSTIVSVIFFGQICLYFGQFFLYKIYHFTRSSLIRIEFFFCSFQLMKEDRYNLTKVNVKTIVIESTQETSFCYSLFFQTSYFTT